MPVTKDILNHEDRVDIPVRVLSYRPGTGSKRAYRYAVEDVDGNDISVLVWNKHRSVSDDLVPGEQCRLTNFIVKAWPGQEPQLHTGSQSAVEPIEGKPSQILHISDTHLGYHLRPDSGGKIMPWDDEVDCRARFRTAIGHACEHGVNAVVHTGDIFDHEVENHDLDVLEDATKKLHSEEIPFFYVLGNHEPPEGKTRLRELAKRGVAHPLEGNPEGYNIGDVALYGLDYRNNDWWQNPDKEFQPSDTRYSVVCLHQTVSPPYSKPEPDCTLDTVLNTIAKRLSPDLVLLGDLHGPFRETNTLTPVYYAGPTGRISYQYELEDPQANLFDFSGKPVYRCISL